MYLWFTLIFFVQVQVITATILPSSDRLEAESPWDRLRPMMGAPFALVTPGSVSSLCRAQSKRYLEDLATLSPWALNMYDASTKIPSGIITGNIQQLGNMEQCLRVVSAPDSSLDVVKGQMCTTTVIFEITAIRGNATDHVDKMPVSRSLLRQTKSYDMKDLLLAIADAAGVPEWHGPTSAPYQWSFCVPAACSASDVATALTDALAPLNVPGRVQVAVAVPDNQCFSAEQSYRLSGADIAFICVLGIVALLLIASTGYDVLKKSKLPTHESNQRIHDILATFSLVTNARNVFSTSHSRDTFTCITGIRVLTLFWVIYGHGYYMEAVSPLLNSSDVRLLKNDWKKMIIMNGTLSTDTFFLISGTLLCYIFLRERSRKTAFNIGIFYLHRYLRLFSPYAAVIFFSATLFFYMGSGPLWVTWNGAIRQNCETNWWTNLLYVNNYIDLGRPCMDHTWYLAIDMQLFWLSPLILYPLGRWPKLGKVLLAAALIAALLIPFLITFFHKLAGAMLYTTSEMVGLVFVEIYTKSYNRAGAYLIGIALGYLLFKTRKGRVVLPRALVGVSWCCSALLCLTVLFGTFPMYQSTHRYDPFEASFYAALHRPVWALGVAWVIFACVQGYGGIVNDILSWKMFLPLSRLSYCAYLCHFLVLLNTAGAERTSDYLKTYNVVLKFLGHLPVILLLSAILSLCFEVPFLNLEKILLSNRRQGGAGKEENASSSCEMKSALSSVESVQGVVSEPTGVTVISDLISRPYEKSYDNSAFATR